MWVSGQKLRAAAFADQRPETLENAQIRVAITFVTNWLGRVSIWGFLTIVGFVA
jgi:hypothetical protein